LIEALRPEVDRG